MRGSRRTVKAAQAGSEGRSRSWGLTYVELITAIAVVMVLASAAVPMYRWDSKRRREEELRTTLQMVRDAIDKYKEMADLGLIVQSDVDQMGYPRTLEELVEGVDVGDPTSPEKKKWKALQRIPIDPMTGTSEWGMRSYQDDWDSDSWGEENVYDIYSLATDVALDGSRYSDW